MTGPACKIEDIMDYSKFIETKKHLFQPAGFAMDESAVPEAENKMFPFQQDIVRWACGLGKAAIFADCGLGKTLMQLQWATQVVHKTGGGKGTYSSPASRI